MYRSVVMLTLFLLPQYGEAADKCIAMEVTHKPKPMNRNWRVDGVLWKPVGEHYPGLVVALLPRGKYKSVTLSSWKGGPRGKHPLQFRSRGDVGDVFTSYTRNGAAWRRKLGAVLMEVRAFNGSARRFVIPCGGRRSDGK